MTTHQLHLFNSMYLVTFVVVAFLTRATRRRTAGALAGAAVSGLAAIGIVALGNEVGWWRMSVIWEPYFLTLLWIDFALCGFIFLLTWRIARRFGGRGLAMALAIAAVLGPVRDYRYLERFPEWGTYGPGATPVLVVAATYVLMGIVGHGVMRLIAGPAGADRLASRSWSAADPGSAEDYACK